MLTPPSGERLALSTDSFVVSPLRFPDEDALPVAPLVQGLCDLLGIDPVYVASEGKFAAVVPGDEADGALAALGAHPLGRDACLIGEIRAEPEGVVALRNAFGGTRIVGMLVGDPLPRIC